MKKTDFWPYSLSNSLKLKLKKKRTLNSFKLSRYTKVSQADFLFPLFSEPNKHRILNISRFRIPTPFLSLHFSLHANTRERETACRVTH